MRAPRFLAAAAAVGVLAAVIAAVTLWAGAGGSEPGTPSAQAAEGPVVDWADGDDRAARAPDGPANPGGPGTSAAGRGAGTAGPAIVAAAAGEDEAAAAVHPGDSPQTTLLAAAGQPVGPGVSGPAAGVTGDQTRPPVDPDDVLPPTAARGGCLPDYGDPGQCLPSNPASSSGVAGVWTCADVRELFPDGLTAGGEDPLSLDTDGDGVACGPGD